MHLRSFEESRKLLELLQEQEITLAQVCFVLKVREHFLWKCLIGKARLSDNQFQTLVEIFQDEDSQFFQGYLR